MTPELKLGGVIMERGSSLEEGDSELLEEYSRN